MGGDPKLDTYAAQSLLLAGVDVLKLRLDDNQIDALIQYLHLIEKWNARYNLTAVREIKQMVVRHLLDALSVVQYLNPVKTLDLGSGAGVPGVVLNILWPDTELVLVDSNVKKTNFLRQVKSELGLNKLNVLNGRIEHLVRSSEVIGDTQQVVSRALASLPIMLAWSRGFLSKEIEFFAMKGKLAGAEVDNLPAGFIISNVTPIEVPFLREETRHLVKIGFEGI